ncbi:hypothetical protein [Humibacter ginsenosidimutans]|uniref:hypothetical protein n=1 Tax=Humibacter ginsenosidimutans TaxID=2599293 RepID=UPI00143DDA90|nr:hypothetical protein [Humibacter ginsenosidimutans]
MTCRTPERSEPAPKHPDPAAQPTDSAPTGPMDAARITVAAVPDVVAIARRQVSA